MKDQVETLRANGIPAGALNSSNDETENANLRRACISGQLKLLYISPEKLLSEADYLLRDMTLSLFAVDDTTVFHNGGMTSARNMPEWDSYATSSPMCL